MNILVVAATFAELMPFADHFKISGTTAISLGHHRVKVLVTGPGMLSTAVLLQRELYAFPPDFVLNVGIAGCFDSNLNLSELVLVKTEYPGDFGAEAPEGFIKASSIGLFNPNEFPFEQEGISAPDPFFDCSMLKQVKSLTVQRVTGSTDSISSIKTIWPQAQIENMEGLAVFYVCKMLNIPFAELRSISNRVEPRNRNNWKMNEAIGVLNDFLIQLFS